MSPFKLFNLLARKPVLRWLVIAVILAGLLIVTSRAWSAPAPSAHAIAPDTGVVVSSEPQPVTPPKLSLDITTVPQALTIAQGAGGSVTVSVDVALADTPHVADAKKSAPRNIVLTASGLPAGVTAACSPIHADGRGDVFLSAASTAAVGPSTVTFTATVTGTPASTAPAAAAPSPIATATLALNVIQGSDPDFTPMVQPGKLSVSQGSDGDCDVSLSPVNGFTGPVTFTASGVPAGVTAVFDPASTASNTTLHVEAAGAAAVGATPVTIVATDGKITHTAHVLLSVENRPDFNIAAWNPNVPLTPGIVSADTFRITPLNGFTAGVGLSVLDLPVGVTARFSPAWAKTGSSTLILNADQTAKPGESTISILATAGGIVHQRHIAIDVKGGDSPSFDLTAWPGELDLMPGGRAANTITVVRQHGFNDAVTLSVSGLPAGVKADLAPPTTHGTSTLTLIADSGFSSFVPLTVQVTGVSGGVSHTTTLTVDVMSQRASQ